MIIIAERVNATRRAIRDAIGKHDESVIREEITSQDAAGGNYIDLNAGTGSGDLDQEANDLCWLIDIALECTQKKLCLDSAGIEALERAAEHLGSRRDWMLNSVNAESEERLQRGLNLVAKHEVPVIALAMDKDGIPTTAQRRLSICEHIRSRAQAAGIPDEKIFFDPLVLPISADVAQGNVTFDTLRGIKEKFPKVKTTMGLSNASHGLKKRILINSAFLMLAIGNGLDSAICDPGKPEIKRAILLSELLTGRDKHCRRFTRALRSGTFE